MAAVVWNTEAEAALLLLPNDEAETIYVAVERMAASGRGFVRDMLDESHTLGLYVARHVVLFERDPDGTIRILKLRSRVS